MVLVPSEGASLGYLSIHDVDFPDKEPLLELLMNDRDS